MRHETPEDEAVGLDSDERRLIRAAVRSRMGIGDGEGKTLEQVLRNVPEEHQGPCRRALESIVKSQLMVQWGDYIFFTPRGRLVATHCVEQHATLVERAPVPRLSFEFNDHERDWRVTDTFRRQTAFLEKDAHLRAAVVASVEKIMLHPEHGAVKTAGVFKGFRGRAATNNYRILWTVQGGSIVLFEFIHHSDPRYSE